MSVVVDDVMNVVIHFAGVDSLGEGAGEVAGDSDGLSFRMISRVL